MAFREVVMFFQASKSKREILKRKYQRKTDQWKAMWAATVLTISFFSFSLGVSQLKYSSHSLKVWIYFNNSNLYLCVFELPHNPSLILIFLPTFPGHDIFYLFSSVSNFWNRTQYWKSVFSFKRNNGKRLLSSQDNLIHTFKRKQNCDFSA